VVFIKSYFRISMEERCRGLMGEQISMGLNIKHAFQWYHKSKLNGTLRPINEVCIDKYVTIIHS
jgi:hypothetical protein